MELTKKQKQFLKNYRELLEYGNNKLLATGLKQKGTSLKKRLLFFVMGAVQSYAEAIVKVMTPTIDHPAIYDKPTTSMLRTITESIWNLGYIYACDTQKNAALFYIDWLQDTVKFANRHKELMIKYPKWQLSFSNSTRSVEKPEDWDQFIKEVRKDISRTQKRYGLLSNTRLPPMEQRCIEHDDYLKSKGTFKQGNSLEEQYVHYYKHFSQIAHLTGPGLGSFMNTLPDGSFDVRTDSKPQEIEIIIPVVYGAYLDVLLFFLHKFGVSNRLDARNFKEKAKSMI